MPFALVHVLLRMAERRVRHVPASVGEEMSSMQRRDLVLRLSIAFIAVATSACATSGSASYESLSHDYTAIEAQQHASRTGDDQALTAATLDQAALVRAVLDRNPSIESAQQGWRAALARVRQAGAFEDPMIDVGLAPLSVASASAPVGYEIGLSQRLPWFAKRPLEASIAAAEAEAAKSDFEAMRRELALTALTLYNQYFVAVRSLEINAQHVELLRAMRANAVAHFEAGRGSAQDSLQAEAELAHMEHDAVVLASQRDVAVAQINELLHRAPDHALPPPPNDLPVRVDADLDGARLQTEAVETRPEISAMRQRARAEQTRADRAEREAYPDLTLSTSYNSMWAMPEHRWMVGLGVSLPLQASKRAGAADEARAARARFESEVVRMSDAARTQVFVALRRLQESRQVLQLLDQRLLPVARDQVDAARAGFIASQTPFMAAVAAEKNLRGVELEYQTARAEIDRRWAELDRALGRIPGLDSKEQAP